MPNAKPNGQLHCPVPQLTCCYVCRITVVLHPLTDNGECTATVVVPKLTASFEGQGLAHDHKPAATTDRDERAARLRYFWLFITVF